MRERFTKEEYDALPEVLTPEQAASMLDMTVRKLAEQAAAGRIPAVRIGRAWRFSKTRLEEFIRG
jgi:excisionase family DNA binding protein